MAPDDPGQYADTYGSDLAIEVLEQQGLETFFGRRDTTVRIAGDFSFPDADFNRTSWTLWFPAGTTSYRISEVVEADGMFTWDLENEPWLWRDPKTSKITVPVTSISSEETERTVGRLLLEFRLPLPSSRRALDGIWRESPLLRWNPELSASRNDYEWRWFNIPQPDEDGIYDEKWWQSTEKLQQEANGDRGEITVHICPSCMVLKVYGDDSEETYSGQIDFKLQPDEGSVFQWDTFWFPWAWFSFVSISVALASLGEVVNRLVLKSNRSERELANY